MAILVTNKISNSMISLFPAWSLERPRCIYDYVLISHFDIVVYVDPSHFISENS